MGGKAVVERTLRRAGVALLKELRRTDPRVDLNEAERTALVQKLGTTPGNLDELLSLDVNEEEG